MVTITYNANGGKGEMKPQAVESGVEVKLNANTFTKDGSDFIGWNEAKDGGGKAYADGATVTPTGDLTLYAQWQAKSTPENPDPENPDPEQPGDGESDVDLQLDEGTAVFDATSGLKLPFTVGNTEALTEDKLTQLLASATKKVTLFTADNETGTLVEADLISHGVDGSTPYISVEAAVFPQESTTYSKIEVVLQAEGYVTQTLTYANVSVNPEQPGGGESDVDLQLDEGTAVFDATSGLKLPFTVGNTEALAQEELTQLLANATKTVTLFTADNETGTPVETGISHGVDTEAAVPTPYISVEAAAFPQESTTYSKIEVVLQAEGYVTQTLTYTDVSVNVPKAELGITKGTAVFNKTTGLTLSFSGSTLPENASASVSLNGTQVDSKFNSDRNAVIVELEALTNDTVDMTVTVTVSAGGYNDAVLRYEGVDTVWIPDGVTATFDDAEKIGSESVSVTISLDGTELSGVTIDSGTYSVVGESAAEPQAINVDGLSFTAPILEETVAKDTGTEVTISLVLVKANAESVTVSSTLKVYPETHVRFNGEFYALAQGFDFTDESSLKDVTYDSAAISSGISAEGFTFTVPTDSEKKQVTIPSAGLNEAVLTLIEMKWDNTGANVYIVEGDALYGWSPYKGNDTFMLGLQSNVERNKWNAKTGSSMEITPGTGSFNKYFILDDGDNLPTLGFNNNIYVTEQDITDSAGKKIATINNPFNITFTVSETENVTYTLKTVAFYTTITP